MQATINGDELKIILKEALVEVLQERRDLLQNAMEDALEDIALSRAIESEKNSEVVSRDEFFDVLKGAARSSSFAAAFCVF